MSITVPLTRPLNRPLTRAITESGVGGGPSAFSAAKAAIVANAGDVEILVIGDSTGNDTTEWVYLFGAWLGTQYPTHSVSYRPWNDGTNVYDAAVAISTGSGGNTVRLWNASVGGTIPASLMLNTKYAGAIEAVSPDLVIWSHGINLYNTDAAIRAAYDSSYSPWIERVQATHPDAGVAIFTQNPFRDTNNYAELYAMEVSAQQNKPRATLLDSYAKFIAAGKAGALYADNAHPSASGTQLYLQTIQSAWGAAPTAGVITPTQAWLDPALAETNLLLNGDFAAWPGALPTSWAKTASATVTKELVIVDGAEPYSLKVEQTGGTTASAYQNLAPAALAACKAAGRVSYAVRRFMPASADGVTAQIQVFVLAPSGNVSRVAYATTVEPEDFWHWMFIRDMPVAADATDIFFYVYASAAIRVGAVAYFSRAVAVAGSIPRDMP